MQLSLENDHQNMCMCALDVFLGAFAPGHFEVLKNYYCNWKIDRLIVFKSWLHWTELSDQL